MSWKLVKPFIVVDRWDLGVRERESQGDKVGDRGRVLEGFGLLDRCHMGVRLRDTCRLRGSIWRRSLVSMPLGPIVKSILFA